MRGNNHLGNTPEVGWLSVVIHPKIGFENCVFGPKIHVIALKFKFKVDIRFFSNFYPPQKKIYLKKRFFWLFLSIYQSEKNKLLFGCFSQPLQDKPDLIVKLLEKQNNLPMPMLTSSASVEESDSNEKASISSNNKKHPKKEYKSAHELGLYL